MGSGVGRMVGFPRPGYLRRRRTVCSLAFTATEDDGESTEAEQGGGAGLGDRGEITRDRVPVSIAATEILVIQL